MHVFAIALDRTERVKSLEATNFSEACQSAINSYFPSM